MRRIIFSAILFIMFSTMSWTSAWAKSWEIDTNHSTVQFGVTHIFSTVFGTFSDVEATIRFDPDHPEQGSFDFIVRVKSINTGNGKRDNHLRSKDFFDVGAYPEMRFQSSKIVHKGENNYVVTGAMTLKKSVKTMEIPFVFHGTAPSPFDATKVVAGFDTEFTLDRLAFGVGTGKFHKMGVVGKDVLVMISVEAIGDL